MKTIASVAFATLIALTGVSGVAFAAPDRHDQQDSYRQHSEWTPGSRIADEDWNRGQRVDYHAHHLRKPPRGHEWRQVDGNYVLAAVATGVIASVIVHNGR
jgi:Ni/Co efflux regulator RcnB